MSGTPRISRAGFGVLHDGSVAGIHEFLAASVFDVQSDQDVADVIAFLRETCATSDGGSCYDEMQPPPNPRYTAQ